MPWNGSGTYALPGAYSPESNGTIIDAVRYNGLMADLAAGITNCLNKNGENSPTVNIPMGGFKFTGLGAGVASGQALVYNQATTMGILNPDLGAVGAPSHTFIGDLDTGMWSPGANIIAVSVGGVEKLRLAAVGFGINTTAAFPLDVYQSTAGAASVALFKANHTSSIIRLADSAADRGYVGSGVNLVAGIAQTDFGIASNADLILGSGGVEQVHLTNDGRLYGKNLHNNAGSVTGTATQYIASGTYTPSLTNGANVAASTAYACQWMRVGNVVTVSGRVDIDPTAAGAASTTLDISLPIASNLALTGQLGGTAVDNSNANTAAAIAPNTVNDRATLGFLANSLANIGWYFQFTYVVL